MNWPWLRHRYQYRPELSATLWVQLCRGMVWNGATIVLTQKQVTNTTTAGVTHTVCHCPNRRQLPHLALASLRPTQQSSSGAVCVGWKFVLFPGMLAVLRRSGTDRRSSSVFRTCPPSEISCNGTSTFVNTYAMLTWKQRAAHLPNNY